MITKTFDLSALSAPWEADFSELEYDPYPRSRAACPERTETRGRSILWGVVLGVFLGMTLIALNESVLQIPSGSFLLDLLGAFYVAILVHELGHATVALATGFEVRCITVGPLFLVKRADGWQIRFVASHILAGGMTGAALSVPERLRERYIRLILGGPAASAILLLACMPLPASQLLRALLYVNLVITLSSCIPYVTSGQPNDAKIILALLRKGVRGDRITAIYYLLALDAQGLEPRDWPPGFIDRVALEEGDTVYLVDSLTLQLASVLETNDAERVASVLESALSLCDKMTFSGRCAFFVSAASFQGTCRKNAELAEAWLQSARKVRGAVRQKGWDGGALAAIAFAKGDYGQARELLKRYVMVLNRQPTSGMVAAERRRMSVFASNLDQLAGESYRKTTEANSAESD